MTMKCTINGCLPHGVILGLLAWLTLIFVSAPDDSIFFTILLYLTLSPVSDFIASSLGEGGIMLAMFLALIISFIAFTIYTFLVCKLINKLKRMA